MPGLATRLAAALGNTGEEEALLSDDAEDNSTLLRGAAQLSMKRAVFKRAAKQKPGQLALVVLLRKLREQVESEVGSSDVDEMSPVVLRWLLQSFLPNYPIRASGLMFIVK